MVVALLLLEETWLLTELGKPVAGEQVVEEQALERSCLVQEAHPSEGEEDHRGSQGPWGTEDSHSHLDT